MGRKRSTKKEPLTKVQRDHNRGQFLDRVRTMMYTRTLGMSPFPFEPRQFYKLVWGEARLEAINSLPFEMFNLNDAMRVYSTDHMDAQNRPYCAMRLNLGMKLPSESSAMLHDDLMPEEERDKLNTWAKLRLRLMVERVEVIQATEGILNTAVTYGQIREFWPTVEQFMPEHVQEQMRKHRRSRPSPAMYSAWSKATKLTVGSVDIMLVEAAMFDTQQFNDPISFITN
jgi:hypothetical protein